MRPIVALWLAALPALAAAEPGTVDWQRKVVRCTGTGAPNLRDAQGNIAVARIGAERAARLDALRNCMEGLKGVRIHGSETVGGAVSGDAGLRARVEGVVKGFKVIDKPRYFSDGGVEMDVEVPLDGVAEVVAPATSPDAGSGAARTDETGLIVDATGTGVAPGLAPRLVDESGREVYGLGQVKAESRKKSGAVAYARSVEETKKQLADRIGQKPRVLRALKADGTDLVIADGDAASLRAPPPAYLAEGRVVIVTD
ncbi:MAG TPA: hypothetical protein VH880_14010 [Anaeromyxobacteraceae bacterium]|jgi:hypothetical protein